MKKYWEKNKKTILSLAVLVVTFPVTVGLAQKVIQLVTGASFKPAAIVVTADKSRGNLNTVWKGLSQGHEEKEMRLTSSVVLIKPLGMKYVRIDHIYDGFGVVERLDGRLVYDWTRLDALVGDIVAIGATPYFSLSYMPPAISRGDILDMPVDWGEWGQVVTTTIEHYSRDYSGGLTNVIYEVWNEPDLFGSWKIAGEKNYTQLYTVAARAAMTTNGVKTFKIGGPATTGFYKNWVDGFYMKLDSEVRIDFFSWHRYSAKVEDFVKDAELAKELIAPQITKSQDLYISEWGVNSERGSQYDGMWAGAHFLAVSRALSDTVVDMALAFEVQDGNQGDQQLHGGWGMLTNPKFGEVVQKPRFKALGMISKLSGVRLGLMGEGDYITAMAARDDQGVVRIMAVNYDEKGKHSEVFPLTITSLEGSSYSVTEEYLSGRRITNVLLTENGNIKREIVLPASEAVLVTVTAK
ncbi:MAG: glycosyl hydrolase [bacterium]